MRLRDDEKKWVDQALYDIEKAFWIIEYTINTRLPMKMSGGMRTESFLEKDIETDEDYINLNIAKGDYRMFHTRALYDANRLISDAMQQFYCIVKGLKLEYEEDSDIYLEAKEKVATRWDEYLRSWWPSKSSKADAQKGEEE